MNKTKTITILLLLLVTMVITGCSGPVAKGSNNHSSHSSGQMNQHDCDEEIAQAAWYETASIDPDWPF